jgi:hypothetical protein
MMDYHLLEALIELQSPDPSPLIQLSKQTPPSWRKTMRAAATTTACSRHQSQVLGWIRSLGIHDRWAGLEKDWVGRLMAAVEDEEDPLYCVQASTI